MSVCSPLTCQRKPQCVNAFLQHVFKQFMPSTRVFLSCPHDPSSFLPSAEPGALRLGRVLRCSDKAELRERHLRLCTGPAQYEIGAVAKQETDQDAVHRQRAMSEAPPDVQ